MTLFVLRIFVVCSMSHRCFLFILNTLYPTPLRYLSLSSAAFFRFMPHLSDESISIISLSIKKSALYGPIAVCILKSIECSSRIFLNIISCGNSFFIKIFSIVFARFSLTHSFFAGLFFNIRFDMFLAHLELYLFKPVAQCLENLYLFFCDSFALFVFIPSRAHNVYIENLVTPDSLDNHKIDRPCFIWKLSITSLNGIRNLRSIIFLDSLYFIDQQLKCGMENVKN